MIKREGFDDKEDDSHVLLIPVPKLSRVRSLACETSVAQSLPW